MSTSPLARFFGVVRRPQTWLGMLFHWLAFPLGLFYFVFLITGLAVGIGLIVIWIGIPILLVVAGAWWLFGAFERIQARYLLGADVGATPREWERVEGVWARLRAHFGSGSTWKDLLYLLVKLPFGIVSLVVLSAGIGLVFWLLAMPVFSIEHTPVINGTWVPPLWFGMLSVLLGILAFFVFLHVLNAWSWVCARWAEVMLRGRAPAAPLAPPAPQWVAPEAPPAYPVAPLPVAPLPPAPPAAPLPEAPQPAAPAAATPPAAREAAPAPHAVPKPAAETAATPDEQPG